MGASKQLDGKAAGQALNGRDESTRPWAWPGRAAQLRAVLVQRADRHCRLAPCTTRICTCTEPGRVASVRPPDAVRLCCLVLRGGRAKLRRSGGLAPGSRPCHDFPDQGQKLLSTQLGCLEYSQAGAISARSSCKRFVTAALVSRFTGRRSHLARLLSCSSHGLSRQLSRCFFTTYHD